jgi:hypothetical protein
MTVDKPAVSSEILSSRTNKKGTVNFELQHTHLNDNSYNLQKVPDTYPFAWLINASRLRYYQFETFSVIYMAEPWEKFILCKTRVLYDGF